jgi:hypothetical protein
MKTIWVSVLGAYKEEVQKLMSLLKPYGMEIKGSFWEDDLEKLSWIKDRDGLIDRNTALWLVLGSAKELLTPSIRYGLSMLSLSVLAQRGHHFPRIIATLEKDPVEGASLPTPLKGTECTALSDSALGAKIVARVHTPAKEPVLDYRLDAYGSLHIGQWFEVGPGKGSWDGCMFGVEGGEITFQAVGPRGRLPDQATLQFPVRGMELRLGEQSYVAWAVQNELTPDQSYFAKVTGFPQSILFGPHSDADEAEVYVIRLK